ncbi:hypothetical protein NG798_24835 [Ancylothrix sp. C2]|uniref:hypothetical protein n=1 Tax=Ancylothrix sp. D3o TaxID=2953691 RepID=UPI0021BB29F8|nr:hypothetical protein [Ancylothrix sp. D3o]MCT7953027.1 hypothetical protein [Ancylothrix sp. D3o]
MLNAEIEPLKSQLQTPARYTGTKGYCRADECRITVGYTGTKGYCTADVSARAGGCGASPSAGGYCKAGG